MAQPRNFCGCGEPAGTRTQGPRLKRATQTVATDDARMRSITTIRLKSRSISCLWLRSCATETHSWSSPKPHPNRNQNRNQKCGDLGFGNYGGARV